MIRIKAIPIVKGDVLGELLISKKPISFLYGIDINTGRIVDKENELYGEIVTDKILYIPHSKGSSVGCYWIYKLKKSKKSPSCILVKKPDEIVVTGCIIAKIPLFIVNDIPIKYNRRRAEVYASKRCIIIRDR